MNRAISCQAFVDPDGDQWKVTVNGINLMVTGHRWDCPAVAVRAGPCDCGFELQTRVYTVAKENDNEAAMEGLRLFCEELEARAGE